MRFESTSSIKFSVSCGTAEFANLYAGLKTFGIVGYISTVSRIRSLSAKMASPARANISQAKVLHTSAYEVEVRGCDAVLAAGEALTYHADPVDADHLVNSLFQRVAQLLPTGGMLIFDLIGLGEPLTGGSWRSGDDWAVLVETVEDQTE